MESYTVQTVNTRGRAYGRFHVPEGNRPMWACATESTTGRTWDGRSDAGEGCAEVVAALINSPTQTQTMRARQGNVIHVQGGTEK